MMEKILNMQSPMSQDMKLSNQLRTLKILMIDASLFTGPYDDGITQGLEANDVRVAWACRDLRSDEEYQFIRSRQVAGVFYPGMIGSAKHANVLKKVKKGISHGASLFRLWIYVRKNRPDLIHFQWLAFPLLDGILIWYLRQLAPVLLTIHDTVPFNGNPTSRLQLIGFSRVTRLVDHIIVHTQKAAETIKSVSVSATPVSVIAHGPLGRLQDGEKKQTSDIKWNIVFFGKIQAYKGVDILLDAVALIPPEIRQQIRITIAGELLVDENSLLDKVRRSGIADCIQFRFGHQKEKDMNDILYQADAFVFPYRQIDASGVFYLVAPLSKWLIASDIGIFHEMIEEGINGSLVPKEDSASLAEALIASVGMKPKSRVTIDSWEAIGKTTKHVYMEALSIYDK